jgi:hypothetical protein
MASDYWTISIAVDKEEVPINFQSINDFPKGNERSMSIGYSHRTPDLLIALRSIVESYQKSHLAYLYEPATVVDPIAIQRAIADINSLLHSFEQDAQKIMRCIDQEWPEQKIFEALHLPATPHPEPALEYGADLPYVIAYFKSHLAVLTSAQNAERYVLHVQS